MENYFNKYYENMVDNYNGYTDTTWYYQDPMYVESQNMNEHILQEMPPAVGGGRNNNHGNNNPNRGNNNPNRGNSNSNRPGNNRPGGGANRPGNPPGPGRGPGGNWNDHPWDNNRGNNQGGWEDMRGGPPNRGPMPLAPPPSRVPARGPSVLRVDAGSIRNCMRRPTYIWQSNGMEYWMVPLNISPTTLSGFRWDGRRGWTFGGVSLNRIDSFTCI